MANSSSILKTQHVSKSVHSGTENILILQDINLLIKQGETVAILGASGSGKTTLLTLLAGIDAPSTGSIYLLDQPLHALDEDARAQVRAQHVGFVFQSFQLLPTYSALENVMLPLELQYRSPMEARQKAEAWLQEVGLGKRLHHYPRQLSGGEQQRVAIARAFVANPDIIFADEMTGNLDNKTGRQIADIVFSLSEQQQKTFVLVTHDTELAKRCHRRLHLQSGVLSPC